MIPCNPLVSRSKAKNNSQLGVCGEVGFWIGKMGQQGDII